MQELIDFSLLLLFFKKLFFFSLNDLQKLAEDISISNFEGQLMPDGSRWAGLWNRGSFAET